MTLASKIQQKNPYVAAMSALLLPSIFRNISICSNCVSASVFRGLPIFVLGSVIRPKAFCIRSHQSHNTLSHHTTAHHITSNNTPSHPFVSHDIALHIPHHTTPHLATSLSLPPHVTSPPNAWHRTTLSHGTSQHHRHHHQHTRETPANNITTRNRWTPVHTKISVWAAHWLVALVVGPAAVRTFH